MARQPGKKPELRRRSGCWRCKEKHVQCTEERPRCSRCVRVNVGCIRGFKILWKEDAVQRELYVGCEGDERQAGKQQYFGVPIAQYTNRWLFLNTTYRDFGLSENHDGSLEVPGSLTQLYGNGKRLCQPLPELRAPTGHPLSAFKPTESYLLDYFIREIAPYCSLSAVYNPYLSFVTPLALSHAPLRDTLLAIAANQIYRLGDRRFEKEAYTYKENALIGLQKDISTQCPTFGVVATILMLCFHDISDGCMPSWKTHLRGGMHFLNLLPLSTKESYIIKQFFVIYFVAHRIMGRTAMEDVSELVPSSCAWLAEDNLEEIDMLMGCSRGLMTIINQISDLAMEKAKILQHRPLSLSETANFNDAHGKLELALHDIQQNLPSYAQDRMDLLRVGEIKRLTALLYLRHKLGLPQSLIVSRYVNIGHHATNPRAPRTRNRQALPRQRRMPELPHVWKEQLITEIISLISTLPNSTTLLWPLFILGNVDVQFEEHRRFILERLRNMENLRNLGNVRRARQAVECAFRAKDIGQPRSKVWQQEVADISLA